MIFLTKFSLLPAVSVVTAAVFHHWMRSQVWQYNYSIVHYFSLSTFYSKWGMKSFLMFIQVMLSLKAAVFLSTKCTWNPQHFLTGGLRARRWSTVAFLKWGSSHDYIKVQHLLSGALVKPDISALLSVVIFLTCLSSWTVNLRLIVIRQWL